MNTAERAIARVTESYELQIREDLDKVRQIKAPESQIEEAFLIGLLGLRIMFWCVEFPGVDLPNGLEEPSIAARPYRVEVYLQQPIFDYRVDFLLKAYAGDHLVGQIIVECDGHFFHEVTKEQARRDKSRDRRLTAAGYSVLRFTGRELYERAFECAAEAIQVARKMAGRI